MTELVVKVDTGIDNWSVPEARAFRKTVGVNPEYAWECITEAFSDVESEMRIRFGVAMDEEDWEPPADFTPKALLNLDPDYLLGFAWIPARRADPELTFDAYAESMPYGDLVAAFWTAITDAMKAAAPLAVAAPNRAERRRKSPAKKPSSRSASSTAGRRGTSTGSPSPKSPGQSATPTST